MRPSDVFLGLIEKAGEPLLLLLGAVLSLALSVYGIYKVVELFAPDIADDIRGRVHYEWAYYSGRRAEAAQKSKDERDHYARLGGWKDSQSPDWDFKL